jgi:hypothetical protein
LAISQMLQELLPSDRETATDEAEAEQRDPEEEKE